MGLDSLVSFHRWKYYKKILKLVEVYVYPRKVGFAKKNINRLVKYKNVTFYFAPRIDISSTFIREQIKKGKDIDHLLP